MRMCFAISVLAALLITLGCGPSQEEKDAAYWQRADEHIAKIKADADAGLFEARVKFVELTQHRGGTYRLCHTDPPTSKKHQATCKRIEEQLVRDEAKQAKDPW